MELRHLRYFVTAAEERNISRASARLRISQPAVSRQIRDLENELGIRLFDRQTNGLQLTEAGEAMLAHARIVLRRSVDLVEAMKPFQASDSTTLRVGFISPAMSGFLAAGLRQFARKHPRVCVQLLELAPADQVVAVRKGELDMALPGTACRELQSEFAVTPIVSTPLCVIVPDDHSLAQRRAVKLAEVAGERFVTLDEDRFPSRAELMANLRERGGPALRATRKAAGFTEMLGMVASGSGIGLAPAELQNLPHPGVVFLPLRKPSIRLTSSAIWLKSNHTALLSEFAATLRDSAARPGGNATARKGAP